MSDKAKCAECGKEIQLKAGSMRYPAQPVFRDHNIAKRGSGTCPGSGEPPQER